MKIGMSKDYITLHKEQSERINHFCESLKRCSYTHKETIEYHKEWLDHIIKKGNELDNMEIYDLKTKKIV